MGWSGLGFACGSSRVKSGLKRVGFQWICGLTGMVGGLEQVGGFCGWIGEADVEVLDRGADYWVAEREL